MQEPIQLLLFHRYWVIHYYILGLALALTSPYIRCTLQGCWGNFYPYHKAGTLVYVITGFPWELSVTLM